MSRIGKVPVAIPAGVTVEIKDGILTVTGQKGALSRPIPDKVTVEVKDGHAVVALQPGEESARNLYGLYRTLVANMVKGVAEGFTKTLEIVGVGYKAEVKQDAIQMALGYSHPVIFPLPKGISAQVEANTVIKVSGADKELVGLIAAKIRSLRRPDVYKQKGIRYRGERLLKKVGKAAGK
ncbi:MAG TPA: 50S ribosomal protein L6 [Candidatus Deferrimicrobiaceae bacterium]|jgi:large subunit ribosomal protein L6|nr:50S ribosomal protein L6 [Candidatus Deferrimicrobiaceae bacterium]HJX74662.1 50S ribosomal protein L6 [Candidatus Deferrimicrobiaceae bacterium]